MSVNASLPAPSFIIRKRTTIGLILFVLVVGMLLFVHHSWPENTFVDITFDVVGYALVVCGVLGRLWCTLYIGGRKHAELQCTGPYSLVRHPLYVSNLLLALGFAALSENPLVLLVVAIYFAMQYLATIRYEETALRVTFGETYAEYARRVPCFIPNFRGTDFSAPAALSMAYLRIEAVRVLLFLAIIPLYELLELLHAKRILSYISFP